MVICNQSCLSGRSSGIVNTVVFVIEHTSQPKFLIPTVLVETMDSHDLTPLSAALT